MGGPLWLCWGRPVAHKKEEDVYDSTGRGEKPETRAPSFNTKKLASLRRGKKMQFARGERGSAAERGKKGAQRRREGAAPDRRFGGRERKLFSGFG